MSEGGVSGRMNRILEITAQLDGIARVSPDDMRHIVRDVARVDVTPGTAARPAESAQAVPPGGARRGTADTRAGVAGSHRCSALGRQRAGRRCLEHDARTRLG